MGVEWIINREKNEVIFLIKDRNGRVIERIIHIPDKNTSRISNSDIEEIAQSMEERYGDIDGD